MTSHKEFLVELIEVGEDEVLGIVVFAQDQIAHSSFNQITTHIQIHT